MRVKRISGVVLLLPVLAGCQAGGMTFEWKSGSGGEDEEASGSFRKASRNEEVPVTVAAGETLFLEGRAGDIVVAASTDGTASLSAAITASGKTRAEADARASATRVVVERCENGVRILAEYPAPLEKGKAYHVRERIDWTVRVPAGVSVAVRSGFGDIRCDGIRGDLSLQSGSGEVRIGNIEGKEVSAATAFGEIGIVSVRAERVSANAASGRIALEGVAAARIDLAGGSGKCGLKEVSGAVTVRLASGGLVARGITGSLEGETGSGDIEAEGAFGTLSLRSGSGSVRVVAARAPEVPWALATSFGDVTLGLPAGAALTVDAATGFGRIETDFSVAVGPGGVSGQGLSGAVGGGGPRVTLRTASGDIRLAAGK